MNLPDRFRLPKDTAFTYVGNKTVFRGETDINRHMNNTYYSDMLWNFIPNIEEKTVTSISLRYMKEAPLGAAISIYMGKLDAPIPEDRQAEETYCFYTEVAEGTNVEALISVKNVTAVSSSEEQA